MEKRTQVAAIPYVVTDEGLSVLLLTSRETKRWVIPKGWPSAKLTPAQSAAKEALEEAGVEGRISMDAIGTYAYRKRLARSALVKCKVSVFALEVSCQHLKWRERKQREQLWVAPVEAAQLVDERDLSVLLEGLEGLLNGKSLG